MIRSFFALALFAVLASSAVAAEPMVTVTNAWARAMPAGAKTGAAYVTITNKGSTPDRLLSAATPVAGEAQLHTTINENGVMKMRPLSAIGLKPRASVSLKPGGMHIMLLDVKQPLKEGDTFPLTLDFEKAGKIETTVMVQKAGSMGGMESMPGMNMK